MTRRERNDRPTLVLPSKPILDLSVLRKGGAILHGEEHRGPLLPVIAKWLDRGRILSLTLKEGRKHQIRRMCREMLGYHVVALQRIRIGPIRIQELPEGQWRPITKHEVFTILGNGQSS